ncbi:MAG: glycosyltransferase family 39 protein [Phycisphaerae bacterium]|nr:glycosyltransferase family 39 protein [Phycisphaerae bacterium]
MRDPWLALIPVVTVALSVRLYDIGTIPLFGDEPLDIPTSILHAENPNPFQNHKWLDQADPSQARLPYYLTGLAIRLCSKPGVDRFWGHAGEVTGSPIIALITLGSCIGIACLALLMAGPAPLGRWSVALPAVAGLGMVLVLGWPRLPGNQLVVARATAAVFGAIGVLATYALGREVFGHWAGLFAAATFGLSPIHIGWSRCAVTTGDTYVTTFFVLALWLLSLAVRRSGGRAMMGCATAFGLAFGAKISAILLWPVCIAYTVTYRLRGGGGEEDLTPPAARRRLLWATLLHVGLLLPLVTVFFWPAVTAHLRTDDRCAIWLIALAVYLAGFAWVVRSPWTLGRECLIWIAVNVTVGGAVVAAFSTPYHLRMEILYGLAQWWRGFGGRADAKPLYLLDLLGIVQVLMIYTKLPINVLAAAGFISACRRRNRERTGLILTTMVVYAAAVVLLHHKAAYYLMPLLPLVHILAGGVFVALVQPIAARGVSGEVAVMALLAALFVLQGVRLVACHPHYLLDGSEWKKSLVLSPSFRPDNMQFQAARPIVEWLGGTDARGGRVAVVFPERRPILWKLSIPVLAFEYQRSPGAQSKGFRFEWPPDPNRLEGFDYVVDLQPLDGGLDRKLPGFERVHEIRIRGAASARIWRRVNHNGEAG